ncbi:MAG: MFS transporter [Streptosporangiaceae bacterium]|jgi:EmrB/QacA subfamily drug resistance transporter
MTGAAQLAEAEQRAPAHGWWPLAVISAAQLMAILDTTVMFVALPSAQHAVGLSVGARQWIITAYTLAFAALLLVGGRLADRLGARVTLLAGVIGFALASAAGGASLDGAMLLAARAGQGASAALLISSTKSLLVTVYSSDEKRSKAIGIFTAANAAGGALGLVLGGLLTTTLGWRWCLYVNVAVALVPIIGGPRVLPKTPRRGEIRIDLVSVVLASAGMAALVYGLGAAASDGWGSGLVADSLAGAAVALTVFIVRQVGRSNSLLPLRVLRDRNRGGALLANTVNNLSTFGMMFVLTYQLQTVLGYSALRTGLALLPLAIGGVLSAAVIAPRLGKRIAPRWLIAAGIVLSAGGLAPLIFVTPTSHYLPLIFAATIIEGIGTGLGGPAMLQTSLRNVLPSDMGAAAAAGSTANQLGSSIGAALLNTIAATATAAYLVAHKGATGVTAADHGFAAAMAWGVGIVLIAAIPAIALVNAEVPSQRRPIVMSSRALTCDS